MAQIQTKFIANNAVTNAKLAQMATDTIKGNNTGGTANASDLTATQVTAMLNIFTSSLQGMAPASGGGTVNYLRADGTWDAPPGATSGTVTSVALADGSTTPIYSISGSPVTSSGTLTFSLETQSANLVFAGPSSGSAAQPTFRTLVNADLATISSLPDLALPTSQLTGDISLTSQVSGILPVANGGTGDSSLTQYGMLMGNGTSAVSVVGPSASSGYVLTSNGSSAAPTFQALPSGFQTLSQQITLASGDITNQYIDLANPIEGSSASVNSLSFFVIGGPIQNKTVDYTVSLTGGAGGVTRVTFSGDLASGGNAALVSGDIVVADYAY